MSSNLRNQSFVFENKQLTEEEYQQKIKTVDFSSQQMMATLENDFKKLRANSICKFAEITKSTNCTGDYLINAKDSFNCFNAVEVENMKNCYGCEGSKDCIDGSGFGLPIGSELLYEVHAVGTGYNSHFINMTYTVTNCEYISHSHNLKDCFGCVGLNGSQYCILNKQYDEVAYPELKKKIIEQIKKTGEYGEFFPVKLSPFGYNETLAMEFYPLTREIATGQGFNWQDNLPTTFGRETIKNLPDKINEAPETITKEVLVCLECQKNYIALPCFCPSCRHLKRVTLRGPFDLHHRQCLCDKSEHGHVGRCKNEFETTYPPDRPERVFCESCYQQEIY
jgi:hypothetical protein